MAARAQAIVVAGLALTSLALACCASRPTSPYSPRAESARDTSTANRLNQEAAALLATDPKRAEALLREALAADLYHGPAHNNLGVIYLKRGELYEAANEFEWARRLMPGHPDPRLNLALTLESAGKTSDALDTYRTALEVYPNHIPTMQALTRLQVRTRATDAHTRAMLDEIALRGETEEWRAWARLALLRERLP